MNQTSLNEFKVFQVTLTATRERLPSYKGHRKVTLGNRSPDTDIELSSTMTGDAYTLEPGEILGIEINDSGLIYASGDGATLSVVVV